MVHYANYFSPLGAPGSPSIVNNDIGPNQLTVTWTPPTTGGVPTSYNVSINNSGSPVVIPHNGSSLYIHTFTGLISDTFYTVSVVAINCAGQNLTSSVLLLGILFKVGCTQGKYKTTYCHDVKCLPQSNQLGGIVTIS